MKNIKKIGVIATILALTLALTACGGGSTSGGGDSADADKVIKVAASPTPHAEILGAASDALKKEGWTLEVIEFEDYVQPNVATTDGDVDANFFQHQPYLDSYNAENGTNLVSVAGIHYEPLGVYTGTKKSFDELEKGDKIGVPNDTTNEARALLLLEANGVIKLKEGAGVAATKLDIVENPKEIDIEELEAAIIPSRLEDLALGVINGNYAIGANLSIDDAIAIEEVDSLAADTYVNTIVVNEENKDSEKTKALVAALQTDEIKKFIDETYAGSVKAKF